MIEYKVIVEDDGTTKWFNLSGQFHREGGPAWESNKTKAWIKNGKLHREDGPAIIDSNGSKEYWIEGSIFSEEEFIRITHSGSWIP